MSELYTQYEHDRASLTASLQTKLRDLSAPHAAVGSDAWKTLLRAAERELDEADEIVASMDNELFSLPAPARAKLQPALRQSKLDQERYRKDFLKVSASPTAREALLGPAGAPGNFSGGPDGSADQRTRLLQGTERLQGMNDRLTNAQRLALESEQSGAETLQELRRQREQLERARHTLQDVDGDVDRAGRTLRSMARRVSTDKLLSGCIVFVLVVLIIMVLILKLR
ncbi:snare region anchored in the vesicle membrane C-terminus-domain-containing protein [Blastocladiella britannica]|nr:snare region anchored in the vesicle membrane C-terminus-domain-containing protein [Blastocladiella britannica]